MAAAPSCEMAARSHPYACRGLVLSSSSGSVHGNIHLLSWALRKTQLAASLLGRCECVHGGATSLVRYRCY